MNPFEMYQNQMNMVQHNNPYDMQQNQMFGMQQNNPYGMMQIRYTKSEYIDGLRTYVMTNSGVAVTSEEKIEDTPDLLRHACAGAGISYLQRLSFYVPETGVGIPFYFCKACGKLFYYKDFM